MTRPGVSQDGPDPPARETPMTSLAEHGAASTGPRAAQRLRAIVLGPRGGGTTRRRASDAFRLGFAVVVVAVSIPVMRANSAVELSIVHALNPPPPAIAWLVTSVFWLGSAGVIAGLAIFGLLVPRLAAIRRIALAAAATWAVCALLGQVLGPAAGRPVTGALTGVDTSYPVIQLAVTIAVAATALPYLSRPLHRLMSFLIAAAAIAAVVGGLALPVNAVSSIAIGWGIAAALHLAVGSPLGLPSAEEVAGGMADLRVAVEGVVRAPRQVWGVEKFTGHDAAGNMIELSVYGRDATDARAVAKLWRFCFYRDSGPTLILDRFQQVEHEAYMTFMAGRAGVLVPEVLAVGRFGPSGDAAIVSSLPAGPTLAEIHPADIADSTLDELLATVMRLRSARIAHGALGAETIVLSTVFPAPGIRPGDRAELRGDRVHGQLGRERPALPGRYRLRGRELPSPGEFGRRPDRDLDHPRDRARGRGRRGPDHGDPAAAAAGHARVRPHLVRIWADLKTIATEPRKIVYVLAGSVLSQLFVALALGASLHAFGEQASISTLLVVITTASMVGGAVPVPAGPASSRPA